jgi:hypothetical protein
MTFSADETYKKLTLNEDFVKEISLKLDIEPLTINEKLVLNKAEISKRVFSDKNLLKTLNNFTHPRIMSQMIIEAKKHQDNPVLYNFIKEGIDSAPECPEEDYVFLFWDWVKWYSDYEEVIFIESFLRNIPDKHYDFVRTGEDTNDNEEYYGTNRYLVELIRKTVFYVEKDT